MATEFWLVYGKACSLERTLKDMCYNEIGLGVQIINTILGSTS